MHNTRPWTRRHICKWDRNPNVRPPALCRVYKATDSRSVISFIQTMADLSDTDTDVEELIDGAEESSEMVIEKLIMRNSIITTKIPIHLITFEPNTVNAHRCTECTTYLFCMEQAVPLFITDVKTLSVYTLNIKTEFQFNQHYPFSVCIQQTAPPPPSRSPTWRTTYVSQKKTNTEYIMPKS